MINDHTNGVYLDDVRNEVFWERLQELGIPLYLHPGDSFRRPYVLSGVPELEKATWEWTTETATHALRFIMTGVFDRYPRAQVILGHMGETLPYMLWRLDSRYRFTSTDRRVKRNPSDYIRDNFSVTTSGQFSDTGSVFIRRRHRSGHSPCRPKTMLIRSRLRCRGELDRVGLGEIGQPADC